MPVGNVVAVDATPVEGCSNTLLVAATSYERTLQVFAACRHGVRPLATVATPVPCPAHQGEGKGQSPSSSGPRGSDASDTCDNVARPLASPASKEAPESSSPPGSCGGTIAPATHVGWDVTSPVWWDSHSTAAESWLGR